MDKHEMAITSLESAIELAKTTLEQLKKAKEPCPLEDGEQVYISRPQGLGTHLDNGYGFISVEPFKNKNSVFDHAVVLRYPITKMSCLKVAREIVADSKA